MGKETNREGSKIDPDFILVSNEQCLKDLENFLIIFNDYLFQETLEYEQERWRKELGILEDRIFPCLSSVKLNDFVLALGSTFESLVTCLERIQHKEIFLASFECKTYYSGYQYYFSIKGPSKIHSINYILFFLINFHVHKEAFKQIFKFEIKEDEFGTKDFTKWKKKLQTFFVDKLIVFPPGSKDKVVLDALLSKKPKNKKSQVQHSETESLQTVFNEISNFYLLLGKKYTEANPEIWNIKSSSQQKGISLEVDSKAILQTRGWSVQDTPITNDQGADLIAQKGVLRLVIQCKNYEKPVGNDAVQQAYSAKAYFDGNIAGVVSVSGFTTSAKALAKKTDILLLNLSDLKEL
jgi:HJR/Mrr/RecB family endonuclease